MTRQSAKRGKKEDKAEKLLAKWGRRSRSKDNGCKEAALSGNNEINMELEPKSQNEAKQRETKDKLRKKAKEGLRKATAKAKATFEENDRSFVMEVQAEDSDEFNTDKNSSDDDESEVVTFPHKTGRNNNANVYGSKRLKERENEDKELFDETRKQETDLSSGLESEGEWKSDVEETESIKDIEENEKAVPQRDSQVTKNPQQNEFNREEIIDAAVAKFQDVIKNSGSLETATY